MAENIAQWLDELGLGQYAQAFADNRVELDHLPHLTDEHLKELRCPWDPRRHPAGCHPDPICTSDICPGEHPFRATRGGATGHVRQAGGNSTAV
jgi:hypothetical protein